MKKFIKNIISGNKFRIITAVCLALMMMIALTPSMGLASQSYFTVIYNPNAPGSQSPMIDTATIGYLYTVQNSPYSNPGFTFEGWNTRPDGTGTPYAPGKSMTVTADLTLYAQWRPAGEDRVTVTYKANANDNQADVVDSVNKGSSYTVRANPFTRPGYTFTGWNTKANGSGNAVNPGQVFTLNSSNTLFAQWKVAAADTVTITYKANAGDNQADVKDVINKGSSYTLRNNPFTRSGYTFTGWNLQANGSGNALNPGQVFTVNSNYTLYAQWKTVVVDLPIEDIPTGVDGRILPPSKTGDSSDWIEIARNGNYSLIVRKLSVNYIAFGPSTSYTSSNVRKSINDFFNGTASSISKVYEVLPYNANLRLYTVQSNAVFKMGTSCKDPASLYDGFSKPTTNRALAGDDVCFALSYCESANFLAYAKFMRGASVYGYVAIQPVPALAVNNFKKLHQSNQAIWLRNPGDCANTVASITYDGSTRWGTVFQEKINIKGLVHPAVWVDSAIFN